MKYTVNSELKNMIDKFIEQHCHDFEARCVDYLGINISSKPNVESVLKIYYNNKVSKQQSHPLIDFLNKKEMVRYVTMVHDKNTSNRVRYDIGLKNRTDSNMKEIFNWLAINSKMFGENSPEIMKLSQMKVTEKEGFSYAGLYFLGFISDFDEISVLKFHFFNRICENPDILHKNICYADNYYLSYLRSSNIATFQSLSELLFRILDCCGGHLWMTGADYEINNHKKYKIYIKNPNNTYEGLLKAFGCGKFRYLQKQIMNVMEWNNNHQKFYCEGFAVCENELGVVSINFYFRQRWEPEVE